VFVVLSSPPLIRTLILGNIEWIPVAGILLSLQGDLLARAAAIPLLAVKPQAVFLIPVLLARQHWGNWRRMAALWMPAVALVLLSFAVWGFWPSRVPPLPAGSNHWNVAPFPWLVPVGVLCLAISLRKEPRDSLAPTLAACVCLTPYLGIASLLPIAIVAAARKPILCAGGLIVFWTLAAAVALLYGA